ncbi:OppA family ABC transporter substrate-binding lipoprotein [Mycoplasma sp. Mirounga ES2805-ORL]|uniref:OppA family ABC transporter substrate-binding lipoprotein n=1 Tax=Mycoplasma sp. Mirounga ES2805-ORL TaxID=754514 RepID=UPI00197BCDA3|nr:hypothetical protein [Mycoplasma sp. Mirounga ES2805-ORL]QSF13766.1 hypothetical protein JXZ90_00485 [Mycoplasma sp. Mirounga ES2805-ORL]
MNKKWLLSLAPIIPLNTMSAACVYEKNMVDKSTYIIEKDSENPIYENLDNLKPSFKHRDSLQDSLLSNQLLRYKFENESHYDQINGYYSKISIKYLTLGKIDKIIIYDSKNNKNIFDNDDVDKKIDKDKWGGYLNYIYLAKSSNSKSINNPEFINKLNKAKKIEIQLKDNIFYKNYLGFNTNLKIKGFDLLNSINQVKDLNEHYLNAIGLNIDSLKNEDNYSDKLITIHLNNQVNAKLLIDELINNKMFSWQPSKNNLENSYKNYYYAGEYVLNENDFDKQIFIKSGESKADIKKIIIKFNLLKEIDDNTKNNHDLNAYEQGFISSFNLSQFNSKQQNDLINLANSANLLYKLHILDVKNSENNYSIVDNRLYKSGDQNYQKLIFGTDKDNEVDWNYYYNGDSFVLRNNINNLINKFSITYNFSKSQYYDNLINYDAKISNAYQTNYENIKDAFDHITKIKLFKLESSKTTILDEYYSNELKSKYFEKDSYANIYEQFKTRYFLELKTSINSILDNFYKKNSLSNSEKINWVIPVKSNLINNNLKNIYEIIKKILNDVDPRLLINIKPVNETNFYKIANYKSKNTIQFLIDLFNNDNEELLINLLFNEIKEFQEIQKFKKFIENELGSKINLDIIKKLANKMEFNKAKKLIEEKFNASYGSVVANWVAKYHQNKNYYSIIKLINEISLSYALPYDYSKIINLKLFNYELIQPWFSKPTRDDNLIYFEDIKVE